MERRRCSLVFAVALTVVVVDPQRVPPSEDLTLKAR